MRQGYSFDDVLLVPQYSDIDSREDIDLSTSLGGLNLSLPILSANMDTVTEAEMAIAMARAGGAGVLHRFADDREIQYWLDSISLSSVSPNIPRIISIGVSERDFSRCMNRESYDAVCIDVAHGEHKLVVGMIKRLRVHHPTIDIIAGNVATREGARRLIEAGANIIKVGVGPGSVCSTRVVTGHGVPQLTAIMDVAEVAKDFGQVEVIADGGIRYPGDIVKSLAAGADAVMIGSLLAATEEAPGMKIVEDGVTYKTYRGMASLAAQQEKRPDRTPRVEGVSAKIPYKGPVADVLANLEAGIRSGLSYSGCRNIIELQKNAQFVLTTSNGLKESHPHHPYQL